ncbi:ABC transporter permease [Kutzneria viridogrisea]|uniref:Transport permease protein n=2 Tax=Kutzneria TaxID=43356 RepID=W5W2Y1_9PSEU|nr:ABC transporter permease [Kutzneria albida]AHH94866.1 ABC transporter [Kutzneria albida DSM 43870]MBA8927790.1 ABC-2 type transport system permease protein [Kutzneria viridogrisea]
MTTTISTAPAVDQDKPGRPSGWHGSSFVTQVWVLTARSMNAFWRDPRMLFFSLLQPLVMLLLFSQVFGGLSKLGGLDQYGDYINYLLPSTLVTTTMTAAMSSGVGLLTEMSNGVIARFRSMPISLFSVLLARSLSDIVRMGIQLLVMLVAAALLFGFRPAGGVMGVVGALAVSLVVGWGLSWLFLAIATWVKKPETMQAVAFLTMFPLMFASSAYMPPSTMPSWVQAVATVNPLSYAVYASRGLATTIWESPAVQTLTASLAISLVIAAVGGWIATRNFRRTT